MLRSKCASASKIAIVFLLIFAATIATSQGSRTSPGIDLINFDNLSLIEYDEPIVYDIGNGSYCNISTGFDSNCSAEITRSLNGVEGKDGRALQLAYGFSKCNNSYVQVVFTFNPPQDLFRLRPPGYRLAGRSRCQYSESRNNGTKTSQCTRISPCYSKILVGSVGRTFQAH